MTERKCCGGAGTGTCTAESAESESAQSTCSLQSKSSSPQPKSSTQTLCIIEELNRIYEDRLQDIDEQAKGDLKLKNITYKEWVDMLSRVMRYLFETLNELETEATHRVALLERKLDVECRTECPTEIGKVRSDLVNLLELIRRALDERKWIVDGLTFQTITLKDIFGDEDKCELTKIEDAKKLSSQIICQNQQIKRLESEKNALKTELDSKGLQLRKVNNNNNKSKICKPIANSPTTEVAQTDEEDKIFKVCIGELKTVLNDKEAQLASTLKENECLKSELSVVKGQLAQKDKVITNMKALTIEVADKHDQIQQMRTQTFSLEEELKKAEKKIHFKDNVIKELRRDCKNVSKHLACCVRNQSPERRSSSPPDTCCYWSPPTDSHIVSSLVRSTSPPKNSNLCNQRSPRPSIALPPPSPQELLQQQQQLDCNPSSQGTIIPYFPSPDSVTVRSGYSEMSSGSNRTMETIVVLDSYKLNNACQMEEVRQMKQLQVELDELFCYQNTHNQTVEDQRKMVSSQQRRLKELIQRLLNDLSEARKKLTFVRNQLMLMSSPCEHEQSSEDSGYTSPEDMEPEFSIINTVQGRIQCLKDENNHLKGQIQQLQCDIKSARSSATNCGKILQEVASAISHMRRKEVSCELNDEENALVVHPICEAVKNLECDLMQKDQQIVDLIKNQNNLGKQCQCLQSKNCALVHEGNAKEQTIFDLQETIAYQNNSIQLLQSIKAQLEEEIVAYNDNDQIRKHADILNDKIKLETECQHQLTTISNLRQALESQKRGSSGGTGKTPSSGGRSGGNSLWSWWRSGVHDV